MNASTKPLDKRGGETIVVNRRVPLAELKVCGDGHASTLIAAGELGTVAVRNQRVVDQLIETLTVFAEHPEEAISQACGSWTGAKAAYGLIDNDSIWSFAANRV